MLRFPAFRRDSAGIRSTLAMIAENYASRVMLCLACSLAVILALVRAPIGDGKSAVGWYVVGSKERISINALNAARASVPNPGNAGIRLESGEAAALKQREAAAEEQTAGASRDEERRPPSRPGRAAALEFAQEMPKIVGGLGAYYIHIEYPEEAQQAGIEGRLVLTFIVETNGRTRDVQVLQPLHPLCDSAAVRALRATHFIPGKHNGEKVPIRMRLPVRFQLVDSSDEMGKRPTAGRF